MTRKTKNRSFSRTRGFIFATVLTAVITITFYLYNIFEPFTQFFTFNFHAARSDPFWIASLIGNVENKPRFDFSNFKFESWTPGPTGDHREFKSNSNELFKELRMCGQQPFLKSRIHCEEDRTCEACLKETEFGKDIPQLQSDELREHLEKYLLDRFGPPTKNLVLVFMVADANYMVLVANWKASVKKYRSVSLVTAAMDDEAAEVAKALNIDTIPILWRKSNDVRSFAEALYLALAGHIVQFGYNLLSQDSDVFWFQDPRPILIDLALESNEDIMCQYAPRWDGQGPCNGGFYYVSNHRDGWFVKKFWSAIIAALPVLVISTDQDLLNNMLRHWRYNQLHRRILPFDRFMRMKHKRDIWDGIITGHFVGQSGGCDRKARLLNESDLWKLDIPASCVL